MVELKINGIRYKFDYDSLNQLSVCREKCHYTVYESEIENGGSLNYIVNRQISDYLPEYKVALDKFKSLKAFL